MPEPIKAVWVCDYCKQPIEGDGYLDFSNANPEHGPLGRYPMVSQDAWERLDPKEKMKELGIERDTRFKAVPEHSMLSDTYSAKEMTELTIAEMKRPANVQVRVYHSRCDPTPEKTSYYIGVSRIETLDQLMSWVNHLEGKDWFGKAELLKLLDRWYRATGGIPTSV